MDFIERPRDRELVSRASEILFKIPGVISVGLGEKLVNGASTGRLAFSILVLEKKPVSALSPGEIIPAAIEGLPTDILEGGPPRLLADVEEQEDFDAGITRDTDEHRPILGGIQIRGARSITETGAHTFGTLGGFAKTTGDEAGQRVLLTNHHVVDDRDGGLHGPSCTGCTKGDPVGNPNSGSQIATVLRGKNNDELDAAIAILDKNVQFQRDIIKDDVTPPREAIGDSRAVDTSDSGKVVHKRGMRSRITYGVIGAVTATTPPIQGKTKKNQIRIDLQRKVERAGIQITFEANNRILVPDVDFVAARVEALDVAFIQAPSVGRFRITEVVDAHRLALASTTQLPTGTRSHTLFVTPRLFGLKGDSGSLVLDESHRVVGLLWAANTETIFGNAWANRIELVEDQLHIKIDSANTIGDTQVAIAAPRDIPSSGRSVVDVRPAAAVAVDSAQPPPVSLRTMVEQDLLTLPRGQQIYQLYFTHHMEVRELIDTNREVALVWHRQSGPGIIQTVLDAVRSRTTLIPTSIRGKSWADRVGAILEIFDRFGSSRLREDIARFGPNVAALGGMTYPRFLETLKA